jgi:SAM-dependent methyltransferase
MSDALPRLYTDLASWFHLLTAPEDYAQEATLYRDLLFAASTSRPISLLELGSGGGNNASHLKRDFACSLVDPAPGMLELSQRLNPECEHVVGDMLSTRLGRSFDAVFIHDAIAYLTTESDLRLAMETAALHCRPGGVVLIAPDCTRETFAPGTSHGGHDGEGRGLRYLAWEWDPDPADTTYVVDYAYLLREGDVVNTVHDRHVEGMFPRAIWLTLLAEVGFEQARVHPRILEGEDYGEMFVAVRR